MCYNRVNSKLIQDNGIGTNLAGTSAIANGNDGIAASVARGTAIGVALAARNLISGNARYGIHLNDAASGSTIQRNFIGTKIDGTTALGVCPWRAHRPVKTPSRCASPARWMQVRRLIR